MESGLAGEARTILVLGDWGRRGSLAQRRVARGLGAVARRLQACAVVTTGDNFYEDGVSGCNDPHWTESFESVYTDPALRIPWYACLGNHDWRGDVEAQILRSRAGDRWQMPDYHYSALIGPGGMLELVVLDTTTLLPRYRPGGAEAIAATEELCPDDQLAWLTRTLARSTARWRLVVGHHPILSGSRYHGGSPELDAAVRPILEEHGVQAYLCGHEHDLQHLVQGHVHYVVSGSGAEWRDTAVERRTRFCASRLGFAALTVSRSRLLLRFYDQDGRRLYRAEDRSALAPS